MDAPSKPTHADINANLLHIIKVLGEENDAGNGGTGILGRLARIENRQSAYDRWAQRILGGFATASVCIAVVWWIIQDKVAGVLR